MDTVTMGVAALDETWESTTGNRITDLLAGADRALYKAKSVGRNHVWMVTDTESSGTLAGEGEATAGQAANPRPAPSSG